MTDDPYLWDRGEPIDAEVERLEQTLKPLRYTPRSLAYPRPWPRLARASSVTIVNPCQASSSCEEGALGVPLVGRNDVIRVGRHEHRGADGGHHQGQEQGEDHRCPAFVGIRHVASHVLHVAPRIHRVALQLVACHFFKTPSP